MLQTLLIILVSIWLIISSFIFHSKADLSNFIFGGILIVISIIQIFFIIKRKNKGKIR